MMSHSLYFAILLVIASLAPFKATACSVTLNSTTPSNIISQAKTVFVKDDVDLGGRTICLSKNSKLVFQGGAVSNGEIVFNETEITGIPAMNCRVSGKVSNDVIVVDWFITDNDLDCLYDNGVFGLSGMSTIEFQKRTYVSKVRGRNNGITLAELTIDGNGATIVAKQGGPTNQSLLMLNFCHDITLKNITLIGSDEISKEEGARHNLSLFDCENVKLCNIISQKAFTDGLYIRRSNHLTIEGFKAYMSGRQGCSVTAGADIYFHNCCFDGSYRVPPMAGLDIEPNYDKDIIDNIRIRDCRFINNSSLGLTIKLRKRSEGANCRIRVENCYFDGNGTNISVASAPKSGDGFIDIANCELKNSRDVSFQSKCYSADGTPKVRFHHSILENANLNAGSNVREQAAFISVHNVSSHPLSSNFGNIELQSLAIKQDKRKLKNIKQAICIYPDAKYKVEDVSISEVSFNFKEQEGGTKLMCIPKNGMKSLKVKP